MDGAEKSSSPGSLKLVHEPNYLFALDFTKNHILSATLPSPMHAASLSVASSSSGRQSTDDGIHPWMLGRLGGVTVIGSRKPIDRAVLKLIRAWSKQSNAGAAHGWKSTGGRHVRPPRRCFRRLRWRRPRCRRRHRAPSLAVVGYPPASASWMGPPPGGGASPSTPLSCL